MITIALLYEFWDRVLIYDGSGDTRKEQILNRNRHCTDPVDALIIFRALTGNDYISSFFRKEKKKCLKLVEKRQNKKEIVLEEFVCQLHGYWNKSTDRVCFQIYDKKYTKENKIDIAALPSCSSVWRLHILRSNMLASL